MVLAFWRMKHALLRLVLPSQTTLARWERTRRRGLVRFIVVTGGAWLGLSVILMALLELVRPFGFFGGVANAFRDSPIELVGVLVGASLGVGLAICLFNEWAYRVTRGRDEP